jgi:hypothetical protein
MKAGCLVSAVKPTGVGCAIAVGAARLAFSANNAEVVDLLSDVAPIRSS